MVWRRDVEWEGLRDLRRERTERAMKTTGSRLAPILAQLRHAYQQLVAHNNRWSRRGMQQFADGLIAPQIRRLEALDAEANPTTWRCFHCDEVFTDKAEAHEHFGDYPDDNPLCLIKGQDGGLAARIRELETELMDAYRQRNEAENDARLWHESEADRVRRIGHVAWWQELDSREGERLVLQQRVKELEGQLAVMIVDL
jgi:hypothetical protein